MKPKGLDDVRSDMAKAKAAEKYSKMDWMFVIDAFFRKYGFTSSGTGAFGYVAIKEDYPYALKVFRHDAGYLKWYDFCKKNQDNPFVPKIRGKIIKMVEDIFYVRLEKLEPFRVGDKIESEINQIFIANLFSISPYRPGEIKLTGNKYIDDILKELGENKRMLDIRQPNVMKRKDGTHVLIDPYISWK